MKYLVIHPQTKNVNEHEKYQQAKEEAKALSGVYGCAVEIKRRPKDYDEARFILVVNSDF